MSEIPKIKKLLHGSTIKAEGGIKTNSEKEYGHLIVDGIDYGNSEDVYNAFAQHARNQGLNQGEFYDQWLTALRNGQDVVFGNGNTVNMKPENMSDRRAGRRSGWTRFWDDTFDTRRNHFSDAVATARRFTFTPQEKVETPKTKKDFDTSTITLNYNPDPKNKKKQIWSNTHADNQRAIQRVSDALAWMLNPDTSDYNPNEKIAAAYKIASGTKDAEGNPITPEVFAENIWNVLRNYTGKDFTDPEVQNALDWLDAFGIVASPSTTPASTTPAGGSAHSNVPAGSGTVNRGSSVNGVVSGSNGSGNDGSSNDTPITVVTEPNAHEKPTLITRKYQLANNLSDDYLWGLNWNGQNYTVSQIQNDPYLTGLLGRMRAVETINKRVDLPQSVRIKEISKHINIPYYEFDKYADWTPGNTVSGVDLDRVFYQNGITSVGISQVKPTSDGSYIFKYYDNNVPGNNPWSFRQQHYLVYNPDGTISSADNDGTLYENAGISDLTIPTFIKNLNFNTFKNLPVRSLQYSGDPPSDFVNFSYRGIVSKPLMVLDTAGDRQLVVDKEGNQYYYNPKTFVLESINLKSTSKKEKGGKIDFNKVNAFAAGGKVIKARGGLSQAMWNIINGMSLAPYNNATAALTIANGGQDTSLVDSALAQQRGKTVTATPSGNTYENQNPFEGFTSENFHPDGMRTIRTSAKTNNTDEYGDTSYDSSPAWTSFIKGGLSALDYGSMAWGRHKVHDQIAQGLKDSLYKRVTPHLQGISTATPIEDAAVNRYDQYIQRGLTTPLTSDNVTNTQNVLTLQANALQGRDQAVRQQSAAALQRQMQNQQIANQQNTLDAEAENDFRARLAGLKMNLAQNDASLTAQTAQSIQNLAREWRTKLNEQTTKYDQLQYNAAVSDQTELSDNTWKNYLRTNHSDAWNTWNGMSTADRNKYGNDITTWIQQSDYWNNALENEYLKNRKTLNQKILGAYKDYNLSPELSWLYRDRYGVDRKKSGGTLTIKQRNRYKNEPWEDIWINQNKETHKLVAKLNDNVIKTFLKTLK